MDVLMNPGGRCFHILYAYQIMSYTLNSSQVCQLHLNKAKQLK